MCYLTIWQNGCKKTKSCPICATSVFFSNNWICMSASSISTTESRPQNWSQGCHYSIIRVRYLVCNSRRSVRWRRWPVTMTCVGDSSSVDTACRAAAAISRVEREWDERRAYGHTHTHTHTHTQSRAQRTSGTFIKRRCHKAKTSTFSAAVCPADCSAGTGTLHWLSGELSPASYHRSPAKLQRTRSLV